MESVGCCGYVFQGFVLHCDHQLGTYFILVIGERLVTPSAIVFLLVKLRLRQPLQSESPSSVSEKSAKAIREDREKDDKFLNNRKDAEDIEGATPVWAHAPHWPGVCFFLWYHLYMSDCNIHSCASQAGGLSLLMTSRTELLFPQ